MRDEGTNGIQSYMDHISDAASFEAFNRHEVDPLLSAEASPDHSSVIDFKTFAEEYPDRLFPLLVHLRPELQEYFIEFHVLRKSQSFIASCHGQIQTRVWQVLRLVEQAIGSLIILGVNPDLLVLHPILEKAGLEKTPHGNLSRLILMYASNPNYAEVAKFVGAPIPAIRKIFRPAIAALLADKNVKAVAVGAYLRSLTHQASLHRTGLSKSCRARLRRVHVRRFSAPPLENAAVMSFGNVSTLANTPWCMLEISSEHRMAQITPLLQTQGKRIFGKKAAQIFAPLGPDGELLFGYIFARSVTPGLVRALTKVRGISEMATVCDGEGNFKNAVTIPHADVQAMIDKQEPPTKTKVRVGDFVKILTGDVKNYCGRVILSGVSGITIEVKFPTGRQFRVTADASSVKVLPKVPVARQAFWGERLA